MSYRQLRQDLLKKLGISPQALSQRCIKIQSNVPMSTKDAIYIIAQQNQIRLDKYLDEDTLSRIRTHLTQLNRSSASIPQQKVAIPSAKNKNVQIGKNFSFTDYLLPSTKISEAREMSEIFPYIYLLENSMREFIDKIMTSQFGTNWWDTQAPKPLRDNVKIMMASDKKDSWHQRRGARPIDYLDFKDLPRLMNKLNPIVIPGIIPNQEWFKVIVDEVYKSRCVVCHMNPLDKNNINAVIVRFNYWQKQIKEKIDLINTLVHPA
jgi:predicted restriction endonuclease